MNFKDLEAIIIAAYEEGVSVVDAEKHAARFLFAQMQVSDQLKKADLSSRMHKSGVKAVRAAVYLAEVQKSDKKPSDTLLEQIVNSNDVVQGEQNSLDTAEVERNDLERYYNIFSNAHIYFRSLAKGSFGNG